MTKADFQMVVSDIDRAAAERHIDLSLPENMVTVWLVDEWQRGKIEYRYLDSATGIGAAQITAGRRHVIIRTTETGRKQIIVWKDGQWLDGYAEDDEE